MKRQVHPEAEAEYSRAIEFYKRRSLASADDFVAEVEMAIAEILDAPARWPATTKGFRRRLVQRFPYAIHYKLDEEGIFIVAIAHTRRRPGYWKRRIPE